MRGSIRACGGTMIHAFSNWPAASAYCAALNLDRTCALDMTAHMVPKMVNAQPANRKESPLPNTARKIPPTIKMVQKIKRKACVLLIEETRSLYLTMAPSEMFTATCGPMANAAPAPYG